MKRFSLNAFGSANRALGVVLMSAATLASPHCGRVSESSAELSSSLMPQVSEDNLFAALQPSTDPDVLAAEAEGLKKVRMMSLSAFHQLMLKDVSDDPYLLNGKVIRNSRKTLEASAATFASLGQVYGSVGEMMDKLGIVSGGVSREALAGLLKGAPEASGASLLDIIRKVRGDNFCEKSEANYQTDYKGLTMNMIKGTASNIIDKSLAPDSRAKSKARAIPGAKDVVTTWIRNTGVDQIKSYATSCWEKDRPQFPARADPTDGQGLPAGRMSPFGSPASSRGSVPSSLGSAQSF